MRWRHPRGGSISGRTVADFTWPTPYVDVMTPSYRKPVGVLAIITGLIIYSGVVARLVAPIGTLSTWLAVPLYAILGVLWLLPLKPVLQWMETGTWRPPE